MSYWLFATLASAASVDLDFTCLPDTGSGIVGVPPIEVRCVVDAPLEGTWEAVTWAFGDGTVATGDAVSYTYDVPGQYSVSVELEGYTAPVDTGPVPDTGFVATEGDNRDPYLRKDGYVTVCGPPEPAFTYVYKGGLDYEIINSTPPMVNCITDIRWDVFEGAGTNGSPTLTFENWSPRFDLPSEGTWTVLLTVGGVAGTRAAELQIDAKYGLTDDLGGAPHAQACSVAGGAGFGSIGLVVLLAGVRRRRR